MTNRELLNKLKELESKNSEILDDEVKILFMNSDYETNISEAYLKTIALDKEYEVVTLDKPDFVIVVNS